jgi:hypothetical protein
MNNQRNGNTVLMMIEDFIKKLKMVLNHQVLLKKLEIKNLMFYHLGLMILGMGIINRLKVSSILMMGKYSGHRVKGKLSLLWKNVGMCLNWLILMEKKIRLLSK